LRVHPCTIPASPEPLEVKRLITGVLVAVMMAEVVLCYKIEGDEEGGRLPMREKPVPLAIWKGRGLTPF
jgi:hypothetical protein